MSSSTWVLMSVQMEGRIKEEVKLPRLKEGSKMMTSLGYLWRNRDLSFVVKVEMLEACQPQRCYTVLRYGY